MQVGSIRAWETRNVTAVSFEKSCGGESIRSDWTGFYQGRRDDAIDEKGSSGYLPR